MSNLGNFVQCRFVTPLAIGATEMTLYAADAPYNLPPAGGGLLVLCDSPGNPSFIEVISYTSRTGLNLSGVVRGLEGTTARAWSGFAYCFQSMLAGDYAADLASKEPTIATAALTHFWRGDKTWQDFAGAVRGSALTGLNLTVATAVAAADSVLVGIGKLQKQITDAATNLAGNVRATVLTGFVNTANTPIVAADSVLVALGKAQAQINDKAAASHTHSYLPLTGGTLTGPIDLNRSGAIASGLSWYSPSFNTWQEYMGQAGVASQGVRGNVTPPVGSLVSSWGRRSYIENSAGYGWVFESAANGSTTPTIMMELSSVTGAAKFTGAITAPTFNGALAGNAATATTLNGDQSNWASIRSNAVANMLGWKNYGNGHVIFDASNSTSPSGSAVNNVNSTIPWSVGYPTLMGWNGNTTYGVRVDSARVADSATDAGTATKLATARTINGVAFDGTANISIAVGETGRLPLTGGAVTGKTSFTKTDQVGWDTAAVEIGAQSGAAYIGFHRHGVYGGFFGLDTGNNFYGNSGLTMSGNITAYSDIRLKTDIEVISDALNKVCTLRGVTYTRIEGNERQTGVIAQEVQAVLPEAVKIGEDVDQTLSVAYGNLVGLLIEAIKELKAEVDVLKQGAK